MLRGNTILSLRYIHNQSNYIHRVLGTHTPIQFVYHLIQFMWTCVPSTLINTITEYFYLGTLGVIHQNSSQQLRFKTCCLDAILFLSSCAWHSPDKLGLSYGNSFLYTQQSVFLLNYLPSMERRFLNLL